jgi:hypothetical protein
MRTKKNIYGTPVYLTLPYLCIFTPFKGEPYYCRMLNVCWVAVRCTVLCEWKSHHLRIHEYNLCTLKIRLIHTGCKSLSNQVKTIHNDCPGITYNICMLYVLEKFKNTHHCLKSKSLFVWLKSKIYLLRFGSRFKK